MWESSGGERRGSLLGHEYQSEEARKAAASLGHRELPPMTVGEEPTERDGPTEPWGKAPAGLGGWAGIDELIQKQTPALRSAFPCPGRHPVQLSTSGQGDRDPLGFSPQHLMVVFGQWPPPQHCPRATLVPIRQYTTQGSTVHQQLPSPSDPPKPLSSPGESEEPLGAPHGARKLYWCGTPHPAPHSIPPHASKATGWVPTGRQAHWPRGSTAGAPRGETCPGSWGNALSRAVRGGWRGAQGPPPSSLFISAHSETALLRPAA